jgi:hypothetical protein
MLRLLERNIASAGERLVILAPPDASVTGFSNVTADSFLHKERLSALQRLRGRIYLNDGALRQEQISPDGRHRTREDSKSWHLLVLDEQRRVSGCIWYLAHACMPRFDQLRVRQTALARQPDWAHKLQAAVESDVATARHERVHYAEVGGWAVAKESRLTDCLLLVLSTYGLSQKLGGAFVVATATVRHASAAVLRRLGGSRLEGDGYVVPPYFEPRYGCEMEILRFDTRRPNSKYARVVDYLRSSLMNIPVIVGDGMAFEPPLTVARPMQVPHAAA